MKWNPTKHNYTYTCTTRNNFTSVHVLYFFHTVVWSHVGMEGQVNVVEWFLRRAASFNINITPFARVCTREDQPKKLLKSFLCYICINGNVLERICKSLDLRFSFTFSFVISTKNVTLFGWYPWRTVRNETQRWNITIKIHPAEVVLEASMTSKLFYYFVHQRKYPGLGVFGSAVHRAYRSNVMPCDTEGDCHTIWVSFWISVRNIHWFSTSPMLIRCY